MPLKSQRPAEIYEDLGTQSPKSPDTVDKRIGARLRHERNAANMSQEELGEAIGVSFQQIQKYEKGVNRIGAGRLQRIADALGLPVLIFFDEPNEPARRGGMSAEIYAFLSSREGVDLVHAFLKIENPAMRRALIDTARAAGSSFEP